MTPLAARRLEKLDLAVKLLPYSEVEAAEAQRSAGGDKRSEDAESLGATLPQAIEERAPRALDPERLLILWFVAATVGAFAAVPLFLITTLEVLS